MLALAFSLSVFAFWTLVGRAVLVLGHPRLGVLRSWLLAPGLGLATLLLALMACNQAGWPIARFAGPLTLVLAVAATGGLLRWRPRTPWRALTPFFLTALCSLVWTGWPALESGFNWISYGNDDMANYCLAAERFASRGFFDLPTMPELAGRDYSSYYYFMHVSDMMRFGAEHIVAWTASITGLKATQTFMPAILALALTQVFSAGALVLHAGRWRRHALVTMGLLAVSPLFMLGTLYQLIAQVGGMALLLVTVALLTRSWVTDRRKTLIRYAVLTSLACSALCIYYPEATPFAALAYGGFVVGWMLRNRALPVGHVALTAYTLAGIVLLLRFNLISYVSVFVMQFTSAMQVSNLLLSLFPYFMLPTGFANIFGWMPIARDFAEPIVSLSIATGMLLMLAVLARAARDALRLAPAAILLLVEFVLAVRLFFAGNDFGLYKLAMFMQPVLAAGLAAWVLWLPRPRWSAPGAVLLFALAAAPTALIYTLASRGVGSGGLTELRFASKLGLSIPIPAPPTAQLTGAVENVVAAKFAAAELRGRPLALVSRDYFYPSTRTDYVHPSRSIQLHPHYADMAQAQPLIDQRNRDHVTLGMLWKTEFSQPRVDHPTDYFVFLDRRLSLFNKFGHDPDAPVRQVFRVEPAAAVRNQLVFVHSGMGNHYYLGNRTRISFFQQESDIYSPGHDFNGLGRFMLLRVEHPSEKIYLRLAATRSMVAGYTAWKPAALVHAAEDRSLGLIGHGAFNLFVGPLVPRMFEGAAYVAIDFVDSPRVVLDYRSGLKNLYNRDVPLDYRRLIGWARDISALTEQEFSQLRRPRSISKFPTDLADASTLEFIGAYEDGWLSPAARFVLDGAQPGELVRLQGVVPLIPGTPLGTGQIHVTINGGQSFDLSAATGDFDWLLPVANPAATTTVELRFNVSAPLPGRDRRPAGAKLQLLGLVPVPEHGHWDYTQTGATRLASPGVDQDGWMARTAALVLPAARTPRELTLRLEYPNWGGAHATVLHTQLDAAAPTDQPLAPGQYLTLRLRVPPSTAPVNLRLETDGDFPLPAPDPRRRACRLLQVELAPEPPADAARPAEDQWDFTRSGSPRLGSPGVDEDGWMMRSAALVLPPASLPRELTLRLEYPNWGGAKATTLHAQLGDAARLDQALVPGQYVTVRLRVPASTTPLTLRLKTDSDFPLPAPDTRRRAGRLLQVRFTPAPP
ncbi:MAG: hypothetical protein EXS32_01310 [Opitutus sp.]|nr:hypothetical protein [Opitutus sp.]